MGSYSWSITTGSGTIAAPGNTYDATVTWGSVIGQYEDRIISVNYIDGNGCTATNPTEMTVRVFRIPQAGPAHHIQNTWND
jgi:hypothetical protein